MSCSCFGSRCLYTRLMGRLSSNCKLQEAGSSAVFTNSNVHPSTGVCEAMQLALMKSSSWTERGVWRWEFTSAGIYITTGHTIDILLQATQERDTPYNVPSTSLSGNRNFRRNISFLKGRVAGRCWWKWSTYSASHIFIQQTGLTGGPLAPFRPGVPGGPGGPGSPGGPCAPGSPCWETLSYNQPCWCGYHHTGHARHNKLSVHHKEVQKEMFRDKG